MRKSAREWLPHYKRPLSPHINSFIITPRMPSPGGYLSLTAVVALIVALVFAFTPHQTDSIHCYDTVTTLSDHDSKGNCFTVSSAGLFSRVFDRSDTSIKTSGHVIPGLIDGHGHLLQFGELLQSVNVFGSNSLTEVIKRVEDYLLKNPDSGSEKEWIRGTGWDQAVFGRMPTAVSLFCGSSPVIDRFQIESLRS